MDKKQELSDRLAKNLPSKRKEVSAIAITKKDIKDDYEFSRETYKDLIRTGTQSMDAMSELARESEHPRAFEVLSNHIRNMSDVTDKLMKLQKAKKDLSADSEKKEVTNNNVFVGSTTDLQRMLLQKDNIIDVDTDDKE
tara:strand:+ start:3018 stop:3434 length:417 start_codon:yes stop_codon:yes gene_type:complete